ncbi:MAG: hypothetical protein K6C05_05050 [Anaerovibrio sp.]|uniref:hypothetical protein n=1 Tax=Anaerovibrio sp. TaxID=1872532 RepID=UPI0025DCF93F|nr:hypothetical protein [Anaerovibrio sp.]MCR5176198.1 hypothetical protein [Anaerovibrio sp.]
MNRRQKVRKHISAAKDWLGRAENSIDKENDVRSDLDMMLAQAELQHAQETKMRCAWKKWLLRTAPLLLAILIGAGYILFLHYNRADIPVTADESVGGQENVIVKDADKRIQVDVILPSGAGSGTVDEIKPVSPEASAVKSESSSASGDVKVDEPPENQAGKLPEADMQRLMQSAGKTLRE